MSTAKVISDDKLQPIGDGLAINYCTSGDGDHPVLFLPGALGSGRTDFTPQLEGMHSTGKLKLIAWDPPGYGKSRPPERTFPLDFFERDAKWALKFMKSLGHEKFSIVGWSDGGITALFMAAMFTNNIEKMVALAANAYFEDEDLAMISKVRDVSKWSPRMREPMEEMYGKDYFPKLWKAWNDGIVKLANATPDRNICRELLPDIRCPSLIIHGSHDAMVAGDHPKVLEKRIPKAKLVLFPDGKHNLHFKHKDRFNEVVELFLVAK